MMENNGAARVKRAALLHNRLLQPEDYEHHSADELLFAVDGCDCNTDAGEQQQAKPERHVAVIAGLGNILSLIHI